MSTLRRGIALTVTAGSLLLTSGTQIATRVVGPRGGDGASPATLYTKSEKESYLTQEQLDFIKPGYHININGVTIGSDRKPVVDVNISDDLGSPLDRNGVQTPGSCSASFVIAWYSATTRDYTSYIVKSETGAAGTFTQAGSDSGGKFTDLAIGHYTYTFGNALPANFDMTRTHTVGIYGSRTMPDFIPILAGKTYNANAEFDFRPDKGAITDVWDQIREAGSCNSCHSPLVFHGRRQDAKLCVLCHSPQTTDADTGNSLDFRVMVHKIHYGSSLPSVVAGGKYMLSEDDFSTVVLPQDIRNCANCHAGRNPDQAPTQAFTWYTYPSRAACGSCHDDINWVTGANHPAGPEPDDSQCAKCHAPQGDAEWDAGIKTAHTVPYRSKQVPGLNAQIVSVTNVGPGKKPTVTFKLTNGDGTVLDPKNFGNSSSINMLLGGPTTDYGTGQNPPAQPIRENASGATFNGSTATYTFNGAIPSGAKGTWTVAIEAKRTINLSPAPKKGPTTYTEGAVNPVMYVAVTDATAQPRRRVVILDNCNNCHDRLATTFSHGGQRIAIEECDICHNPHADDSPVRPASANPPEAIVLKRLIHRIHSGTNLTQDFTIYGFNGAPNNFNGVRYPGDRKNCVQCHDSSDTTTYDLPLPNGVIPAITQRDYFSPQGPATTGCLGCHDTSDTAAHAYLNTVQSPFFGKACATCHGDGKDWDVVKVHAR